MKPGLKFSKSQRIITFYVIGLILPGIILGFFAFRGLRNDQALQEKQNQQELKLLSIDLFSHLDNRMDSVAEELKANPKQSKDHILISWIKNPNEPAKIMQGQLLFWPDGSQADRIPALNSDKISAIQKIEFSQKNYPLAIRQYQSLLEETVDKETRAQVLLGLARVYKKSDQFAEAISTYQTLTEDHPGELLPGGLPAKAQALLEIIRLSTLLDSNDTKQKATAELIRFLLDPPVKIDETPYTFLLDQSESLSLSMPDSQREELNNRIAKTRHLLSLHQMSSGLLGWNQGIKYLASENYPGLLFQNESDDGILHGWVLAADMIIPEAIKAILTEINPDSQYQWAIQMNGGKTLGAIENENPIEIAFPPNYPPWYIHLAKKELSGWDRIFKSSQGVLLLVFVFIFLLMIAGLVFMLYTLSQEMKVSKMKSQFISNVSHEFKTPLTSIRHMTEIMHLKRIDSEERKEEYLQSMLEQCDHLGHLIENILDFSKIEEDIKNYRFEEHQLDEIITDLIPVFRGRIGDDSYELNVQIDALPPPMLLDKDAIQQVLFNLLDNAYKYSNGGRRIDLHLAFQGKRQRAEGKNQEQGLREKLHGGEVCILIRDYGIGISEKDLGRIFERFYRGDRLRTEGIKGSGIGLTIVSRVVQAHGGRIEVESEIDKGTTFRVYLPVKSKES